MKISLTREEMLKRRRTIAGLEPLRTDCSVTLNQGLDVDELLELDLRNWYLNLLDTAHRRFLATEDVSSLVSTRIVDGHMEITLPTSVRRVFELRLSNWFMPVTVLPGKNLGEVRLWQHNPYTVAKCDSPVAVAVETELPITRILAWPATEQSVVECIIAVRDPGKELYIMDECALPAPDKKL